MKKILLTLSLFLCAQAYAGNYEKVDDLEWAQVKGHSLKLDIYSPSGASKAPVVVIYHGGGWLINNESVMDEMSAYLAEMGYVVANVNYRLLVDNANSTHMNEIVEDAMGGLLWVKAHIEQYGGDPTRVAVTGDSAGGHLASMVVLAGRNLGSDGFAEGSLKFKPTWLPEGKSAEQVASEDGLRVQAAVISYGAFDIEAAAKNNFETGQNIFWQFANAKARGLFGDDISVSANSDFYRAVSPLYLIPKASDYTLPPQFHHVGSADMTTPEASIKHYVEASQMAGQEVELKVYRGFNHAYLDSGCLEVFGSCFNTHAVLALQDIVPFLDKHLKN